MSEKDSKQKAIIVDLDGTLANIDHRLHHIRKSPKDWKRFHSGITDDLPQEWCVEVIHKFFEDSSYQVLFLTGRPGEERVLKDTKNWLARHKIPYHKLFMREAKDFRQDYEVKKEIYQRKIEPHYEILFVIEDRQQVVEMWREIGLTCLHCDVGHF